MLQIAKKWRFCRWHTFLNWLTSRYFRTILTKVRSTLKYRGGIASIIGWARKSRQIQLRNSQSTSKMKKRVLEMRPYQTHPVRHSSRFREDTATLICLNLLTNSSLSKTRRVAFQLPLAASITVWSAKQSKRRFQITMSLKNVSTIRIASPPIQIVHLAARTALHTRSALWPSFLPRFLKPVPIFASSKAKPSRKSLKSMIMWRMQLIIRSISAVSILQMTTRQIALCLTKICTVLGCRTGWGQTQQKNQSLNFLAG